MKAMILSAGYGKRLLPLTNNCPKPLLKIGRETLLNEIGKIGKSLGSDYITELELRLNGTFSSQQELKYTLDDGLLDR